MKFINPKNGEAITSNLSRSQVAEILKGLKNDSFAQSLFSAPRWSQCQEFHAFRLAEKASNPVPAASVARQGVKVGSGFLRIQELFNTAIANALKRPKIRLQSESGDKVTLSLAPSTGKNANHVYVKVSDVYAGKIAPSGEFFRSFDCPPFIESFLSKLSNNPAKMASDYGHTTGSCCFCALELTDTRSVTVGYGPICAGKYGLPWGEI